MLRWMSGELETGVYEEDARDRVRWKSKTRVADPK